MDNPNNESAFTGSSVSINSLASTSTGTLTTNHSRLVLTNSLCTTNTSSISLTSTMEILEEKPFIPGIQIRASTIERLIERCVDCFDPVTGELLSGNEYVHVLFMMHKWVMNSHDLANRFLRLYQHTMRCQLQKKMHQRHRLMSDPPSTFHHQTSVQNGGNGNSPDVAAPQSPVQLQPTLTASPSCASTSSLQSSGNLQAESGYNGSVNNLASSLSSSDLGHKAAERSMKLALQHSYAPSSSACDSLLTHSSAANNQNNGNANNNSTSNNNSNNPCFACNNSSNSQCGNSACSGNSSDSQPLLERSGSVITSNSANTSLDRGGSVNTSFERASLNASLDRDRDRECSSISISPESSSGVHAENDVLLSTAGSAVNNVFFQSASSYAACPVDDDTRKRVYQICFAMKYWITKMPVHFDTDDALARCVADFTERLKNDGFVEMSTVLDTSEVPTFDWMRMISVRCPSRNMPGNRNMLTPRKTSRGGACTTTNTEDNKVALVFNKLKPEVIADQLTVLEYKAFRRIPFNDFKQYATTSSLDRCQRLERSIVLFNGLTQWVECMILSRTTPQERAEVISKFIEIAKRLYHLQNFNSLMAVVGGICHSAISRLSRTFACLDVEMHKILTTFSEFLSSSSNYGAYRRHLAQCRDFRIPILGVHLKDLICTHTAMNDYVPVDPANPSISSSCYNIANASSSSNGPMVNLINFRKLVQLSMTFDELMQIQGASTPVEENTDLCNMLKLSLDMSYSEEEIYELSLAREPRNSLTNINASVKPVLFAEFVAGRPPDPETVNKHVRDMVEAVFKVYDHDKDGFISQEEFEDITQNFPFIDAFCILDTDNDGVISRSEMLAYFIKGNSRLLRSSFKHNFHETTYFRPTYCAHCSGLLWGIIKQGWKCRDCGINAHRHCKDQIVCECRQRSASLGANANPQLVDKENKRLHQRAVATSSTGGSATTRCNSHDGVPISGVSHDKAEHPSKSVSASNSDRRRHQHPASLERSSNKSVRRRHTIHTCQGTQTDDVILEETLHEMNEQFEENESSVLDSHCSTASVNSCLGNQPVAMQTGEASVAQHASRSHWRTPAAPTISQQSSAGSRSDVSGSRSCGPWPASSESANESLFTHNSIARTSSTSSIGGAANVPTTAGNEVARSASACCPSTQERRPLGGKGRLSKPDDKPSSRVQKSRVKFAQIRNSVSSAESTGSTNSLASVTSVTSELVTLVSMPPCGYHTVSFASVATQMPVHCASVAVGTDDDPTTCADDEGHKGTRRPSRKDATVHRPVTVSDSATSPVNIAPALPDSPYYESAEEHYRRLLKAEADNEQLALENAQLKCLLRNSQEQLQSMRAQMNNVRHHTIEFILHQMDVLHVQRDSEV